MTQKLTEDLAILESFFISFANQPDDNPQTCSQDRNDYYENNCDDNNQVKCYLRSAKGRLDRQRQEISPFNRGAIRRQSGHENINRINPGLV